MTATTTTYENDLAAGIAHVDAYEYGDGYAYDASDEGSERRYLVDAAALARLGEMLRAEDDDARRDAYSLWCAEIGAESEDVDADEASEPNRYTYTIFDGDPAASGDVAWPSHDGVVLKADDDEDALEEVRATMEVEAAGLSPADGYAVGDRLYALVWDASGEIIGTPTYDITAEDLGDDDDCRLCGEHAHYGECADLDAGADEPESLDAE